jgi:hypothetical protein
MTLYEKYQLLVKRGMPKHPNVKFTRYNEPSIECALDGVVAILTALEAKDLITAHAQRWWVVSEDKYVCGQHDGALCYQMVKDGSVAWGDTYEVVGCGLTILDAIIHATGQGDRK